MFVAAWATHGLEQAGLKPLSTIFVGASARARDFVVGCIVELADEHLIVLYAGPDKPGIDGLVATCYRDAYEGLLAKGRSAYTWHKTALLL